MSRGPKKGSGIDLAEGIDSDALMQGILNQKLAVQAARSSTSSRRGASIN